MADREKVMQWLKICANGCEDGCPYEYKNLVYRVECKADLMSDALELLKEQEPKRGRWVRLTGMAPPEYHGHKICSVCECFAPYNPLHVGREVLTKYCPGCGAEMEGSEVG